jgi:CheY-like chemotaxis protein
MDLGTQGWLTKPVSQPQLAQVMSSYLQAE